MDKNKKKVLIVIVIILVLITLLTILLSFVFRNEGENPNNNPNQNNVISKNIERLTNEKQFFTIQQIINDFYLTLSNHKTSDLLNLLDSDYILERNINANNLYTYLKNNYEVTSYVAKSIYYNPNSSVTYYFVNGYLIDISLMSDENHYYDSINYLIIVDEKNNHYQIRPIDNQTDIFEYAKEYDIMNREINNSFEFSLVSVNEENKLAMYMNEFLNFLIYDSNRAYQLLNNDTQKMYGNSETFKTKTLDIYSQFSSKIFSYSVKESGNMKIYTVKDDKQNNITIYESAVMDFKISY